jgi:hypothetical protein
MDELVNLIVKKTGIPKETAKQVVTVVIDFLKKKLPAPIAGQVDAVLSGKGVGGAVAHALDDGKLDMNDATDLLGGLLGGKKK